MKITSHFGIIEVKPKKIIEYKNHKFAIVDYPHQYMNAKEPLMMVNLVHFNTGISVLNLTKHHNETLKAFVEKSLITIENCEKRFGTERFENELKKFTAIN